MAMGRCVASTLVCAWLEVTLLAELKKNPAVELVILKWQIAEPQVLCKCELND